MAEIKITSDIAEVMKEPLQDAAQIVNNEIIAPIAKPTGEIMALIPRAIKAALSPLEKWILHREYSVKETLAILERKLADLPSSDIVQPEAHIAVPALQYIGYCMDNDELREMYANLLASSMNDKVRKGVRPSFVEIIKQLSPDEAKILRHLSIVKKVPIISVQYTKKTGEYIEPIEDFSTIVFDANCENPLNMRSYFDNLLRLRLADKPSWKAISDKTVYEPLINHDLLRPYTEVTEPFLTLGFENVNYDKKQFLITAFGRNFCEICLPQKQ